MKFFKDYIQGLILEYTDSSTVTLNVGECRSYSDEIDMSITSTMECDLSTSGLGGLYTGSVASNTWYYIFLLKDYITGDYYITAHTSVTPTFPAKYQFRRMGTIKTDPSSNIIYFQQNGVNNKREVIFSNMFSVLTGGSETSWTDVDCSAVVPETSNSCLLYVTVDSSDIVYLRAKNLTTTQIECLFNLDTYFTFYNINTLQYQVETGSSLVDIKIKGFIEEL